MGTTNPIIKIIDLGIVNGKTAYKVMADNQEICTIFDNNKGDSDTTNKKGISSNDECIFAKGAKSISNLSSNAILEALKNYADDGEASKDLTNLTQNTSGSIEIEEEKAHIRFGSFISALKAVPTKTQTTTTTSDGSWFNKLMKTCRDLSNEANTASMNSKNFIAGLMATQMYSDKMSYEIMDAFLNNHGPATQTEIVNTVPVFADKGTSSSETHTEGTTVKPTKITPNFGSAFEVKFNLQKEQPIETDKKIEMICTILGKKCQNVFEVKTQINALIKQYNEMPETTDEQKLEKENVAASIARWKYKLDQMQLADRTVIDSTQVAVVNTGLKPFDNENDPEGVTGTICNMTLVQLKKAINTAIKKYNETKSEAERFQLGCTITQYKNLYAILKSKKKHPVNNSGAGADATNGGSSIQPTLTYKVKFYGDPSQEFRSIMDNLDRKLVNVRMQISDLNRNIGILEYNIQQMGGSKCAPETKKALDAKKKELQKYQNFEKELIKAQTQISKLENTYQESLNKLNTQQALLGSATLGSTPQKDCNANILKIQGDILRIKNSMFSLGQNFDKQFKGL